ncbi:MAG: DUF2853 family protein [Proteobacteria bacterium]|nr:DUF2853 family protein [Pseudomonadota bacterium]
MATDWAADVKKYVPDADDGIIAAIVRYCGIALRNRDSSLVSYSDSTELDRVRNNFLKKKLALTDPDSVLDEAIAKVGQVMKGDRTKNRVTVYYLLAAEFNKLSLFEPKTKAAKTTTAKAPSNAGTVAAAGAAGAAAAAALASSRDAPAKPVVAADPAPVPAPVAAVAAAAPAAVAATGAAIAGAAATGAAVLSSAASAPAAAAQAFTAHDDDREGGLNWLWILGGLALLGLAAWWLFGGKPADQAPTVATPVESAAPAASGEVTDLASAPAEGTVTIPTGAGVTSETRDGKPVVKVYFDTGKTDVAPAFAGAAGGLKAWLGAHPGSKLGVSGFADPTGNAKFNAELSKKRAEAVQAELVTAGIPQASAELVKPKDSIDTKDNKAAARRVEVTVQ